MSAIVGLEVRKEAIITISCCDGAFLGPKGRRGPRMMTVTIAISRGQLLCAHSVSC